MDFQCPFESAVRSRRCGGGSELRIQDISWKRFQCGGIVAGGRIRGSRLTQSWSHRLIIGSATALGRNPGDVAVWILHVAGFAVDAILGVDDEAWPGRLLDPLVDAGGQ